MTPADTGRVLVKAAAYDQRTIGEADVLAWHEILGDLDPHDCLDAVAAHYAESTDRLMPAHVRRHALAIARERRRLERETREAEREAIEAAERATIQDRSEQTKALLAELRDRLGPSDRDALVRREWAEFSRWQRRMQVAQPNPHYRYAHKLDPTPSEPA